MVMGETRSDHTVHTVIANPVHSNSIGSMELEADGERVRRPTMAPPRTTCTCDLPECSSRTMTEERCVCGRRLPPLPPTPSVSPPPPLPAYPYGRIPPTQEAPYTCPTYQLSTFYLSPPPLIPPLRGHHPLLYCVVTGGRLHSLSSRCFSH